MADTRALDNWHAYVFARDHGHHRYVEKANKAEQFYYGEQWSDEIRKRLHAQKRPALTINKVFSTMNVLQGEQIVSAADITFQATATGQDETAQALSKLWLHAANENMLRMNEEFLFLDGMIGGRGFFDVRMDFTEHLTGDIRYTLKNPKNIVIDPDADEYDPNKWNEVFETWWYTWADIARLYGADKGKIFKNRRSSSFSFGYDSIDEQYINSFGAAASQAGSGHTHSSHSHSLAHVHGEDYRTRRYIRVIERQYRDFKVVPWFVDMESGDMREIPEGWDREKIGHVLSQVPELNVVDRKSKMIQWTTSADDIELFHGRSPYRSFTTIPFFPYFHHGRTMGVVEHLIDPQEQLNKASSQELHVINTTANSGWKVKYNSLRNMTMDELEERGAETGLVLELDDIGDAEKITANGIPQGLDRISFKSDESIKDLSGVSDSKRGFDRADVAAKAIVAKQRAGSVNSMVPLSNLIHSRHFLARKFLELVQDFYTDRRVFRITTGSLVQRSEEIAINDPQPDGTILNDLTIGEYDVRVVDVPLRDSVQDTVFQQASQLREMGVQIPDFVLIEASQLPNKMEIAETMRQREGFAEPSESEEKMAQLELQAKEIENQLNTIRIQKERAEVALTMARARKEAVQSAMLPGQEGGDDGENDQRLIEVEKLELEERRRLDDLRHKERQLQLERDKFEADRQQKAKDHILERIKTQNEVKTGAVERVAKLNESKNDNKGNNERSGESK